MQRASEFDSISGEHLIQDPKAVNSPTGEQEFDPFAFEENAKGKPGSGRMAALLALLLALVALASVAWQFWQDRQAAGQGAGLEQSLQRFGTIQASQQETVQGLADRLATLEQLDASALAQEVAGLKSELADLASRSGQQDAGREQLLADFARLSGRLGQLETAVASLAQRGENPAHRLDLSEIEFLLRQAPLRLRLFADRRAADETLAMAAEQLASLDDPYYLPVQQSIVAARTELANVDAPDALQLSGRLAALQRGLPTLPFAGDPALDSVPRDDADVTPEDGLWARFKRAMSGLVTVRRRVSEDEVLSLQDQDFVRQGLWLQYETARLALMRLDSDTWNAALQRALDNLQHRFASESERVRAAIDETRALMATPVAQEFPDISAPWTRLMQLRQGQPSATASRPPAEAEAAAPDQASVEVLPAQADAEDTDTGSG